MGLVVKYCKKCFENPELCKKYMKEKIGLTVEELKICVGYYTPAENENKQYCHFHPSEKLYDSKLTIDEYELLTEISVDSSFIRAMEALKEKDPIEYQLKLTQFKAAAGQQEQARVASVPKCPTCGSTNIEKISSTKRWLSTGMFGIASSNIGKTMHCKNCGAKW